MMARMGRMFARFGIAGLKHGSAVVPPPGGYVPTYYIIGF